MSNADFWASIDGIIADGFTPEGLKQLEYYAEQFISGKLVYKRFSPFEHNSIFSFLRKCHTVFHRGSINLHSHQECKKIPFFSTPSPTFIVYRFFDDGHSDWCEVLPYCSFGLHMDVRVGP